jgi:hypothetical protein
MSRPPLFGSRHLCRLLRGRPRAVNHVCSAASQILSPQYHFGGLGCAVREATRKRKQVDSTDSILLPETVTTLAEFGGSDGT